MSDDTPDFSALRRTRPAEPAPRSAPPAAVTPPAVAARRDDPLVQFTTRTDLALRTDLKLAAVNRAVTMEDLAQTLLDRGMATPISTEEHVPVTPLDGRAEAYMSLIRTNNVPAGSDPGTLKAEARITDTVVLSFKMRRSMKTRLKRQATEAGLSVQEYVNILLRRGLHPAR